MPDHELGPSLDRPPGKQVQLSAEWLQRVDPLNPDATVANPPPWMFRVLHIGMPYKAKQGPSQHRARSSSPPQRRPFPGNSSSAASSTGGRTPGNRTPLGSSLDDMALLRPTYYVRGADGALQERHAGPKRSPLGRHPRAAAAPLDRLDLPPKPPPLSPRGHDRSQGQGAPQPQAGRQRQQGGRPGGKPSTSPLRTPTQHGRKQSGAGASAGAVAASPPFFALGLAPLALGLAHQPSTVRAAASGTAGFDPARQCPICRDVLSSATCCLKCGHTAHVSCFKGLRSFGIKQVCAMCRRDDLPAAGPERLYDDAVRRMWRVERRVRKKEAAWDDLKKSHRREMDDVFKGLEKAAHEGHVRAQYTLGAMHAYGRGVKQDFPTAVSWCAHFALRSSSSSSSSSGVPRGKPDMSHSRARATHAEIDAARRDCSWRFSDPRRMISCVRRGTFLVLCACRQVSQGCRAGARQRTVRPGAHVRVRKRHEARLPAGRQVVRAPRENTRTRPHPPHSLLTPYVSGPNVFTAIYTSVF